MPRLSAVVVLLIAAVTARADDPKPIKVLFLGDRPAGHRPNDRLKQMEPEFKKRGITFTYTTDVADFNEKNLAGYDAVMIYSNITRISPEQEKALLDFVENGKGFCPLHCASYCFQNSPKYIALVGAQFRSHGMAAFKATPAEKAADHPIMKGYVGFESTDETYVHTKHNETDRTVLEYRIDGGVKEPWTWVRTQGKGRVFYTAWGHDQKTWSNPGFLELVERGLRWSVGQDPTTVAKFTGIPQPPAAPPASPFTKQFPVPETQPKRTDVKPFEYEDVGPKIPDYRPRGGQGQPMSKMQKPLEADESLKHLVLPKGFHAEVWVTEKELGGKPICMTWDEKGRLWACLTMDYPNQMQPKGEGRDKIVVCEDTKGTGRCDKVTVFADKLSIPTSISFARGGVLVYSSEYRVNTNGGGGGRGSQSARTYFMKSTTGDDKADVREMLFGTWSQGDTHGGPSNMNYGLDNWVYGMQGYNDSTLTVGGETHRFRQGFYRFKSDGSKLEFLRSTNNNTWGLGLSEEGIVFGSTANGNPSEYMPIPNRYYEMVKGWTPQLTLRGIADSFRFRPVTEAVRQVDYHGGYTAAAGHALYTARNYPQEYWNRTAFVCEPTGHLVGTFVLRSEGSNFKSHNPVNLVASDDEWTAPIMAEVGPDGNVWVLDWYNFIVQHNPTPRGFTTGRGAAYENDLRDKTHGRIYKIVYDGAKGKKPAVTTLAGATPDQLVAALANDNLFWRRHAQRLLVERNQTDVVPGLIALVKNTSVDPIGLNVGAIHALWTLHGLGALDGKNAEATAAAVGALKHPSAGVRRNAVQVLPKSADSVTAILAAGLPGDSDPQVRLMTLLALADQPQDERSGAAAAEALTKAENAQDKWIPDAATAAAAGNSVGYLKTVAKTKAPTEKMLTVAGIVAEHYARATPGDSVNGILVALAGAEPKAADAIVRGLAKGWPMGKPPKLDAEADKALGTLANRLSPERRGVLVRLAAGWGSTQLANIGAEVLVALKAKVADAKSSAESRVSAAGEWLGYAPTDKAVVAAILNEITPQAPPELAVGLLTALRSSESADTGKQILDRIAGFTPAARAAGFATLLSRTDWSFDLLAAADAGKIQIADLALDQKQGLANHPDQRLSTRAKAILARGGALPSPDRQKVIDDFGESAKMKGDPGLGKVIFKNQCSKCHQLQGEGTAIGPDLTGMAVHPKEELLISILDPSRSVEGNFRLYKVTCKDGKIVQGMLAGESKTAVELIDTEGKKFTVLRDNIDELTGTTKSLMPDGFEKQVSKKDMGDLLEYLTQKGKYLPLSLDKVASAVSTKGMFNDEESTAERMVFADWKPKTFEGVPFTLTDPKGDTAPNVVLLYGPQGKIPPKMPKSVSLSCQTPVKAIHMLSGVSGWGSPYSEKGSVSMIVRVFYADGKTEDHELKNGEHFADYISRNDVPGSKFAFNLRGKQVRYLKVTPKRPDKVEKIELVKGPDNTAPVVMAVTLELPE
jgi:putative membrane-bound dehydrogenase-like protein